MKRSYDWDNSDHRMGHLDWGYVGSEWVMVMLVRGWVMRGEEWGGGTLVRGAESQSDSP